MTKTNYWKKREKYKNLPNENGTRAKIESVCISLVEPMWYTKNSREHWTAIWLKWLIKKEETSFFLWNTFHWMGNAENRVNSMWHFLKEKEEKQRLRQNELLGLGESHFASDIFCESRARKRHSCWWCKTVQKNTNLCTSFDVIVQSVCEKISAEQHFVLESIHFHTHLSEHFVVFIIASNTDTTQPTLLMQKIEYANAKQKYSKKHPS